MTSIWEVKMRALLCMLFVIVYALADKNDNRRHKLPYVADAVGNSLPPPSSVPAKVGSPVALLTPDRYEFYTFDESGELVKRLMTLEEIQAIVAAGEETEGLVTFANENQPTIAFNFSQPPDTKVHSVVTNVQNVLKAQMEAHKNKPHLQPTLDTPDVSDSWSLILPSIFGNTGVDIVPDKSSGSFTTPETETLEEEHLSEEEENSLSKEETSHAISSTTLEDRVAVTEKIPIEEELPKEVSTTTTTIRPLSTTTTQKPISLATTKTPIVIKEPTTKRPVIKTTSKPSTTTTATTTTTTTTTTTKPSTSTTTIKPTTAKPVIVTSAKTTSIKPEGTTVEQVFGTSTKDTENAIDVHINPNSNAASSTEQNEIVFEKISTFIPVSTVKYVTTRSTTPKSVITTKPLATFASTTKRSIPTTKTPLVQISSTTAQPSPTTIKPAISTFSYIASPLKESESEKVNVTTITTQSVSPSTTVSSTEVVSPETPNLEKDQLTIDKNYNDEKDSEPIIPLFDVAQSISQIASDLGGNYQPIPTTANFLDTTKINGLDLESKENLDLDIPSASGNDTEIKTLNNTNNNIDNFVKISTFDPKDKDTHETESKEEVNEKITTTEKIKSDIILHTVQKMEVTTATIEETTMDPILSESMGDLLSQVVNQAPQSIIESEENADSKENIATTEKVLETTAAETIETTPEISVKVKKETSSSTTEASINLVNENETTTTIVHLDKENKEDEIIANNFETTPEPIRNHEKNISKDTTTQGSEEQNENGNFVQIAMFSNHNETEEEVVFKKNITTINSMPDVSKIKDDAEKNKEDETTNEKPLQLDVDKESEKMPTEVDINKESNIEITTLSLDNIEDPTTVAPIIENKFPPSNYNKINTADKLTFSSKKEKLPEALPKVDDFKKKIQKVNIDEEELLSKRNNSWKLIPTLSPPKANEIPKDKLKSENYYTPDTDNKEIDLEYSQENQGLEVTTKDLGDDIAQFTELCNELAFRYWNVMVENIDKKRSFVLSPYSITSMLAMMFMGARGATSGEMNEILKLDDMVTFNPHFTLKNISDSIETTSHSGVAVSAFIRELYSDRTKGKILTFYKERAQHFYNGHVEEINFKLISDIIRRRTNLLVKRYTWGKIPEYMKTNNIVMQPPLAAFSANIFETDCSGTSVDGRDGEMYFVVSPNVRQRRLVPVPAVVYKYGFLAGYDPVLDATAAALGNTNSIVSTLFLMPGQQGNVVHADDLEKLEQRLLDTNPTTPTWSRLLRSLLPRTGLELQIPRFSHKSIFNVSSTLKKMGLKDLFDSEHADLGGLNGPSKDLFLSDMIQLTTFVTCGEGVVGEQHHIEEYPETLGMTQRRRTVRWVNDWDEPRDYQRAFHDPHDVGDAMHLPLHLRPRQARLPARSAQPARLKYDRPFLYFVRHNPTGMILYFGRYNPRLLP